MLGKLVVLLKPALLVAVAALAFISLIALCATFVIFQLPLPINAFLDDLSERQHSERVYVCSFLFCILECVLMALDDAFRTPSRYRKHFLSRRRRCLARFRIANFKRKPRRMSARARLCLTEWKQNEMTREEKRKAEHFASMVFISFNLWASMTMQSLVVDYTVDWQRFFDEKYHSEVALLIRSFWTMGPIFGALCYLIIYFCIWRRHYWIRKFPKAEKEEESRFFCPCGRIRVFCLFVESSRFGKTIFQPLANRIVPAHHRFWDAVLSRQGGYSSFAARLKKLVSFCLAYINFKYPSISTYICI
jgi:hypothetical protein